jgi:hypothetical protein
VANEHQDERRRTPVDAPDGQVPAPRRPALPRGHRVTPADLSGLLPGDDAPRVPELSALLAEIDALRLTLQTDLSLAAAALEAGADDLAGELVDSDLAELRAFAGRATRHLADLDAEAVAVPDEVEVDLPVRRRRVLSAAPLMAAAAALVGFVTLMPTRGAATPESSMSSAALAGYELSRLASQGAPDEQLRRAAEELNDELAMLIAQAADDPAAAQQALLLLEQTSEVLAGQGDSGVLRDVMAETRALRARLREALPPAASRPRPLRPVVKTVVPLLPRVQEQPEKERASAEASPAPKSSPKPSPTAAAPSPSPSPAVSQGPSPSGSPEPEGPLPQPGDAPGGGSLPGS